MITQKLGNASLIQKALEDYFQAIESLKGSPSFSSSTLRSCLEKLEQLTVQLSPKEDPQLHHFMTRKSYEKALNYLQESKS